MVKISSIFALGIIVTIIPFTGFPFEWKRFLYISCGLLITGLSLLIRKELHEVVREMHNREIIKNDTFVESIPAEKNTDEK